MKDVVIYLVMVLMVCLKLFVKGVMEMNDLVNIIDFFN